MERERENTRRKEQIVTTKYMNAVNIHVCARSYAQYIERERTLEEKNKLSQLNI